VTIHSFTASLARSEQEAENPIWRRIYTSAFPTLVSLVSVRADGWAQRGGIDRVLTLSSGKTLTVDEKVRTRDYGDILLEYWSDERRRIPGWVAKDLACDFIAYAMLPTKRCFLLPFHQLRSAWRANGRAWVSDYPKIVAENENYQTISVGVPIDVLFSSMREAMTICWDDAA
jgi:hypothetical protein